MTSALMSARFFLGFMAIAGCTPYATASDPAASVPTVVPTVDAPPSGSVGAPNESMPASSATPATEEPSKLEVVLSGRPIDAFAIGETHVFTLESDVRTRLVATEKAAPHGVKVLLDEDILDGVSFESVATSRGRVFVADTYGAVRSRKPDGTDAVDEFVTGTRVLSAPQTLWIADPPRFLGDYLTFTWSGAVPAQVAPKDARLFPDVAVGAVAVDDQALIYATRTGSAALRHWAPAVDGDRLLAELPEEGRGLGIDESRVYVYLVTAKEVRSYDRATGAPATVLSGAAFDTPPQLGSDGQNLYFLTETALRRCSIASCGSSLKVVASNLLAAHALVVDRTYVWMVMTPRGKTGIVARLPK